MGAVRKKSGRYWGMIFKGAKFEERGFRPPWKQPRKKNACAERSKNATLKTEPPKK